MTDQLHAARLPDAISNARWRYTCRTCGRGVTFRLPLERFTAFGKKEETERTQAFDIIARAELAKAGCRHTVLS
jgi:hypothetical protein